MDLIVANYNNGRFLPQLIESILKQTDQDWELYIVDDCSSDNSLDFLAPYSEVQGLNLIQLKNNGGATNAFKVGIEAGTSDLIGLIGADDALTADAIEQMKLAFQNDSETVLAYSECMDCDESLNPIQKRKHAKALKPDIPVFEQLYSIFNFIVISRRAYNQTIGLDSALRRAMDHDLMLKMDEVGRFTFVPQVLYHYRTHDGGISQGNNWMLAELYSLLARIKAYERRSLKPVSQQKFKRLMLQYHRRSLYLQASINGESLFHHMKSALIIQPTAVFQRGFLRDCLKAIHPNQQGND